MHYDFLILGAGIIGAALAAEITARRPAARVLVLEKEPRPAFHQTGRNSGVVHSGVYYTPGSLKTRFCHEGMALLQSFCQARGIGYRACGKLLVATQAIEVTRLERLAERATINQVEAHWLSASALQQHEPAIAGLAALRIPATAITDYGGITRALLADVESRGGEVRLGTPIHAIRPRGNVHEVRIQGETLVAEHIIACTGLQADRVAAQLGMEPGVRIVPFRGEYFVLPSRLNTVVQHMIYPVPDPDLPFLGVHLTPMIDGTITVGPNAVLSLAREGYGRFSASGRDAWATLSYPGFWKLMGRHWKASCNELASSLSRQRYLAQVRKYCPSVQRADLFQYRSANRAQAVRPDGTMVDDFLIRHKPGATVVINAPSPAATGCLPIARAIADGVLTGNYAGLDGPSVQCAG